jgi:tRNA (guanosine-2'-O-)-methyltransferase
VRQLHGTPLKRFLRDWRRAHPAGRNIVLVLNSVAYPVNVGSLFRIADAVRVREVVLCGITPVPPNNTIASVGRGKHEVVSWRYQDRAEDALAALRGEGYHITALEITDTAKAYYEASYPDNLCLVVGNEDHGVTRSVLSLCDSSVFVPMYGRGHSLNVHVCAAVVLYHLVHQHQVRE